jgi:hypothetical protein
LSLRLNKTEHEGGQQRRYNGANSHGFPGEVTKKNNPGRAGA